ncbi:MAG: hypothetical protein J6X86_02760 [Bacteroidales bacterium]|nr:hypothetical protein [Bacteroidales bacterium]
MKKNVTIGVALTLLSLAIVSCQKENEMDSTVNVCHDEAVHTVVYSIDGVTHQVTLRGDDSLREFIYRLLTMAKMGHQVSLYYDGAYSATSVSKETITYNTPSQVDASDWCDKMAHHGYSVSFYYDETLELYVCTATK